MLAVFVRHFRMPLLALMKLHSAVHGYSIYDLLLLLQVNLSGRHSHSIWGATVWRGR